jgi:hypothetical protein
MINYKDKTSNIYVTTDASDHHTSAVLSFRETWEMAHPVAYDSYQLNDAEKNYPTHEKELLAIVKVLKKWRSHLLGARFEVYTDHCTLKHFQAQKEMLRCQMRWSMYLADFDYSITYVCGEQNTTADALSHMPNTTPDACLMACTITYTCNAPSMGILSITTDKSLLDRIIAGYETDNFTQQLTKDIGLGSIEGVTLTDKLLYVSNRLVIPQDLHIHKLLYNLAHDTLRHFGFNKSYESLRGSYYWLNMCQDLKNAYIPSCTDCQWNKSCISKPTSPLHPLPVPDNHFNTIALDFTRPLPTERIPS